MRSVGLFGAALIGAAAAAGIGCGGSDGGAAGGGLASCTISESVGGDGGVSLKICEEVTGSAQTTQSLRQSCMSPGGGLVDGGVTAGADFEYAGCSHVGALGACRATTGGMTVTGWYYDDGSGLQTSADIQMLCGLAGETFIAP